jgi:DNA-binding IclR family transcriptional regulator
MHKTTVLRLARTLAQSGYMVQCEDGSVAPGAGRGLARDACYQSGFQCEQRGRADVARALAARPARAASFYVREGAHPRLHLARGGPAGRAPPCAHRRAAAARRKGAPGRVILAFSGEQGKEYEAIRRRGYHISMGEREAEVNSVSAPVFGLNWRLLGLAVHLRPDRTPGRGPADGTGPHHCGRGQPAFVCPGREPEARHSAGRGVYLAPVRRRLCSHGAARRSTPWLCTRLAPRPRQC